MGKPLVPLAFWDLGTSNDAALSAVTCWADARLQVNPVVDLEPDRERDGTSQAPSYRVSIMTRLFDQAMSPPGLGTL